ncbi:3-hydroxyacyl-ACP dehydratase FabZ [Herbivorax sp. ANBcel31]|uniref:3-hydroxyacyl-ACP dehydratase FabZ n=1 Tax=Herbivorax sp. ANBcel31 TaxID=3069754 RepID=UPI0027B25EF6|nr:3-hydroxyacyl-ACP dehydratase FabZ [Herbivorax sp. ANBcel31]MDQ2085432.1 3-hydroxyacyl-ACP dehydratase FabZ [Herbivorax sp. ANBcel31]
MIIDANLLQKILPHKAPFLLLDKVIELEPGKKAVGIKNITINEPYFTGHFPTRPIVPGVLIVESLAQLTAVMYCSEYLPQDINSDSELENVIDLSELASKVGYLVDIKNIKFKKLVVPGDTLELHVIKNISVGLMSSIKVAAYVNKECVVEGNISVSQNQ